MNYRYERKMDLEKKTNVWWLPIFQGVLTAECLFTKPINYRKWIDWLSLWRNLKMNVRMKIRSCSYDPISRYPSFVPEPRLEVTGCRSVLCGEEPVINFPVKFSLSDNITVICNDRLYMSYYNPKIPGQGQIEEIIFYKLRTKLNL